MEGRLAKKDELKKLQIETFSYFLNETNPNNGLIIDKTSPDSPASIAATGLGLTCYPIAVERGFISRNEAIKRVLATLRFFWKSHQGPEADATGYHGFYYHFLDMKTGKRFENCELSTIDTAILFAGMLTSGTYFENDTPDESEIRYLATELYLRADWLWAMNNGKTLTHGWKPGQGFLKYRWNGYDEALILYILALGSPTFSLPEGSYAEWASTYQWITSYGREYLYAGPLFTHQISHIWIDFRGIMDAFMRTKGIDYFENSRRATYVQMDYAIDNPQKFSGYSDKCWGITASDGPGPAKLKVDGVLRKFYDYVGRGVPFGPDDGTIAPWAVVASLPFAPEIVLPSIEYFVHEVDLKMDNPYGFKATFNPTFPHKTENRFGWISKWHTGINQGPILPMIENYLNEFIWNLTKNCPYIIEGLKKAKFTGGWLQNGEKR